MRRENEINLKGGERHEDIVKQRKKDEFCDI